MRRQIAAVHGRDVARVEGTKIPRVVPVVEMTAKALQAAHRRERRFQSLDGLQRAGPAEVAGADRRQQVQAEIGGRGAMGQNRPRVLLKVVRRQHVVVRSNERLEVAPGAPRDQSQGAGIRVAERQATLDERRAADPNGNGGRCDPQDHERRRHPPGIGPQPFHEDGGGDGDRNAATHAPIGAAEVEPRAEVRLGCSDPLQQIAPCHEQTNQCSADGIDHQPRLVCKQDNQQGKLRSCKRGILAQRTQVAAGVDAGAARHDRCEHRQQGRQGDRRHDKSRPDEGGVSRQQPSRQQRERACRRGRRAPQVIQHLPPADQWQRAAAAGHVIAPAQDPRQQLPVAARPAMLARGSYVVSRRKLLNDLDVGNKTGARKYPFEQIVAEQRVLGYTAGQRGVEGVDVIDALAGIRTLTEQILVDVGHCG